MSPPTGNDLVLIVEDSQAYRAACRTISESPAWRSARIRWATHSPHLAEALPRAGVTPILMDADVTQTQADAIGYAALDASRDIARFLDARRTTWPLGLTPGWPLRHVLHRALSAYMYKAYLLARLRGEMGREAGIVAVGSASASPVAGYNVMPNRFDTLFSVIAGKVGLTVVAHSSVRPTGAMENGDYMRASIWSRATTMLNAPVSSVAYRILGRLSRRRPLALPFGRYAGVAVAIIAGNELVEDTFLELLLGGAAIIEAPSIAANAVAAAGDGDSDIVAKIGELVMERFRDLSAPDPASFAAVANEIAERTVKAVTFGAAIAHSLPVYVERLKAAAAGRPLAVLSNAMSDGPGNLLRDALRNSGVPVLVAEHGVAPGLSDLHDAQMARERPTDLEDTLFWTPIQKAHAVDVAKLLPARAIVTGLPNRLRRIGAAGLQRLVVRRQLGIRRQCVAWCTGLYPNNMQFLPHYWRDTPYHFIRREVLDSVLTGLDCDVLLKLYPTYRYTDPDPLSDRKTLPANVRVEQFTDFRSLRAAADVILIDGPGSILGWCWDIDKPLIFFETGMYTLLDDVRDAFRRSVFYVDVRAPDWKSDLRAILTLPLAEIRKQYADMLPERRKLGAHCILGPEGAPGKRAAEFVFRRALESAAHTAI